MLNSDKNSLDLDAQKKKERDPKYSFPESQEFNFLHNSFSIDSMLRFDSVETENIGSHGNEKLNLNKVVLDAEANEISETSNYNQNHEFEDHKQLSFSIKKEFSDSVLNFLTFNFILD